MASTYLTRAMNGDSETIGTISLWVKRAKLGQNVICSFWEDSTTYQRLQFDSSDRLNWKIFDNNTLYGDVTSTRKFRDTTGWYHIVSRVDTTQSTASDRVRLYVNGEVITAFDTTSYPTQNRNVKQSAVPYIGTEGTITSARFDGCMSHIHYTDAASNAPTVFGETDATTGEWKIKTDVSTTYGAKGFFILKDGNSGTDHSGNSNNFTAYGNLTNTEDCPSNVFTTLNPLLQSGIGTLTNGNLSHASSSGIKHIASTLGMTTGKFYAEVKYTGGGNYNGVGIITEDAFSTTSNWYSTTNGALLYYTDVYSGGNTYGTFATPSTGDIIGIALDLDNGYMYLSNNGTWGNSGDPTSGSSGTGGIATSLIGTLGTDTFFFASEQDATPGTRGADWNFGNGYFGTTAITSEGTNASGIGKFEYDVPTGYTALSTKGLNE